MLDTSQALPDIAPNAVIGNDTTVSRLTAAFAQASEPPQVDNSEPEPKAEAEIETDPNAEVTPDEKSEEPEKGLEDEAETDDKADKPDEKEAEDEESEADFKGIAKEGKYYLTPEEAKAEFQRNASDKVINALVQASTEAKAGNELKAQLGGEHFIEPLTKISTALQTGEFQNLFEGIVDASSSEALMYVLGDAVRLAFVMGPQWADQPGAEDFGKAMEALVDVSLKERYGPTATAERLGKLAEIDNVIGLVERVEKWRTAEFVDPDEVDEMMASLNDPKYAALIKEKTELQRQLEEKATQAKSVASVEDGRIASKFGDVIEGAIETTLKDIVWKTSVLRDVETDTPEMKAEKAFLRSNLQMRATTAFNQSKDKTKLLADYKEGRQNTATFKKQMADMIDAAILETKEPTSVAERMLAKVYGTKRNAKIPTIPKPAAQPEPQKLTPTVPSAPPPPAVKSRADTKKTFEDYFSSQPA